MITRIEIDGFKSFAGFTLDLPPFLAVIGTNASGKSNLFDALRFLSALARRDLYDAIDSVRGDPLGIFRQRGDGSRVDVMRFAVESIVDFRQPPLKSMEVQAAEQREGFGTRWRYELTVRLDLAKPSVWVADETFAPIAAEGDHWAEVCPVSSEWRAVHLRPGVPADVPGLTRASLREGTVPPTSSMLNVLQVGPIARAMGNALREVSVFQWEDAALRSTSPLGRHDLQPNGAGLPAYLLGLGRATKSEDDPVGVLADIRADLVRVVRDVTSFEVIEDDRRRDVRIEFRGRHGSPFDATVASDGTLRVLAVLAALNDPARAGLTAIEEPENGVFPGRLRELLMTMREMASDPLHDPPTWPLRQVLIASHSPIVLDVVPRRDIVFLESVTRLQDGVPSRITQARPLAEPASLRPPHSPSVPPVTESELDRFRAGGEVVGR